MAVTLTKRSADKRELNRDIECMIFEVDSGLVAATVETAVRALPPGVFVGDIFVDTYQADVGGTSTKMNIKIGARVVWTGTADNGGAIGRDFGTVVPTPAVGEGSGDSLIVETINVGGSITTAAKYRVFVELFRFDYPETA